MSYIQPQLLLDAVTTGTGLTVSAVNSARDVTFVVTGKGTISAGTLVLEESDDPQYLGSWSLVRSIDCTALTGGGKQAYHVRVGAGLYMRARMSVNVTGSGGAITVSVTGA